MSSESLITVQKAAVRCFNRLCSLAIKTGNVEEAIDYYDDFMQIAPKDPNQYI